MSIVTQPEARYAVITIQNPFRDPFVLIPNAYKTLHRYIEVNGLQFRNCKDVLECFERQYATDGITYMDVYIAVQ